MCLGLTCHSEGSLIPPSRPAADDPPAVFVHCEAADAALTAHWKHRAGHLKTHTHSLHLLQCFHYQYLSALSFNYKIISQMNHYVNGPETVEQLVLPVETFKHCSWVRLNQTLRHCRFGKQLESIWTSLLKWHFGFIFNFDSTCSSELIPASRDGRRLETRQRALLKDR